MSTLSNDTYLGIEPGQEYCELQHYPIVDRLIEHMLRANVNNAKGKHSVPFFIGKNALHPLLGIRKTEVEGMPIIVEKTQITAQLTGSGRSKSIRGLHLELSHDDCAIDQKQSATHIGIPIHHSKDASKEYLDRFKDRLVEGLPREVGYLALCLEIAPEETDSRLCTLYGRNDEGINTIMPFMKTGATQLAAVTANALLGDIHTR